MAKLYTRKSDGTYIPQPSVLVSNLDIVQDKGDSLTSAMSQKAVTDELKSKQDTISDLDAIRQGAEKGSTALQSESDPIYTADKPNLALKSELDGKVDKEEGKGLSSNDYTDEEKAKLSELVTMLNNKLDLRFSESYQPYETDVKTGALLSSTYNTQYSNASFCNTTFPVQEGERYRIKGWSVNSDYCGLWLRTRNTVTKLVTAVGAFEEEVTIPSGFLSVCVNAKLTGDGALSVEKWVENHQTSEEFYQEVLQMQQDIRRNLATIEDLRDDLSELVYTHVQPDTYVSGKYITLSRVETEAANYNYGVFSVNPGDKFRIRGWNLNASIPLAFVYSSVTGLSSRLIYKGSATNLVGEAIIPDGFDKLYVNGHISQSVIVHKITKAIASSPVSRDQICVMPFVQSVGIGCVIARRMNDTYDAAIRFAHNTGHPNIFFDYGGISFLERGVGGINNIRPYAMQFYTMTDYIMPIVVAAVNNANGDFPTNTSYFTGGFHAYGNATSGNVTPTMRQISQSVIIDGVSLVGTEAFVYGNKVEIDVVNNLQGCNTEKADGTGREIMKQHIHIFADKSQVRVKVEFVALEAVKVYQMDGIGQFFPFDSFRLVGSKTKKGIYTKGTLQRPDNTDRNVCAIRSFNDSFFLECGLNPSYAEGDCKYNSVKYNVQATEAGKGYFHMIAGEPVELAQGEMLSFEGYFDFGINV